MELIEHIAKYLNGNGIETTSGIMPAFPARIATVYATGVRPARDGDGSRFQVIVRSEADNDTALGDIMRIIDLLDDFSGITDLDSPYFARIQLESGAAALGADDNRRPSYSANFRAWVC